MRVKDRLKRVKWEGRTFLLSKDAEGSFPPLLLNETADQILRLLATEVDRDKILSALLAEYDVEEAELATDLDYFLEQLRKMGLLEE